MWSCHRPSRPPSSADMSSTRPLFEALLQQLVASPSFAQHEAAAANSWPGADVAGSSLRYRPQENRRSGVQTKSKARRAARLNVARRDAVDLLLKMTLGKQRHRHRGRPPTRARARCRGSAGRCSCMLSLKLVNLLVTLSALPLAPRVDIASTRDRWMRFKSSVCDMVVGAPESEWLTEPGMPQARCDRGP